MKHSMFVMIGIFGIFTGCVSDYGEEPMSFGATYGIIRTETLPRITSDSLLVRVAYSGCSGGHSFALHHRVVDLATAEMWLTKTTSDQMCEAYFEETRAFSLPEVLRNRKHLILLTRGGGRFVLRATMHYQDSLRFAPQAFRVENDTVKLTDIYIDCYGQSYQRIQ